jgi:hypothetical protein
MDSTIEVIEHRGHRIEVCYDEEPLNPRRDWDHCSTMLCFHGRYDLGDDKDKCPSIDPRDFEGWEEMEAHLRKEEGAVIVLPLSLYDHSGITMVVGSASGWDCGQVGWIYATRAAILENFGRKVLSKKLLARAEAGLRAEVETYDQYLTGQVYGYVVKGPDCDDSCWGFFNQEDMVAEAKASIDDSIRQLDLPFRSRKPRLDPLN